LRRILNDTAHIGGRPQIALAALALLLAGCSSSSLSSMMAFGSSSSSAGAASASAEGTLPPNFECPSVDIRHGASTLSVSADPREPTPVNMRYQVGIGQTARECKLVGTTVAMKIGVQGRVIVGPAGGPGQVDVPLRFAVVHEGPEPKTITTKLQRLSVTVPPGSPNMAFTHIEEEVSFPMPRGGDIDQYVVYIGFDPAAVREPPRRQAPARSQRRGTT
jgi:hypothetical protein